MLLPKLSALLVLTTATAAQAQFGNFFQKIFGGTQETFVESVAQHNTHTLTSENWLDTINATNPLLPTSDDPQEWLLYFTASEEVKTQRNVSMWDSIYMVSFDFLAVLLVHRSVLDGNGMASREGRRRRIGELDCAD